jgi:hypothetical protein
MAAKTITLNSRSVLWYSTKLRVTSAGRSQDMITVVTTLIIGTIAEKLKVLTSVSAAA